MTDKFEWNTGLDDFRKNELTVEPGSISYRTEFTERDFEPNRTVDQIFHDHLASRESKTIELLYSGGMDSQFVLESFLRTKVPVEVMTMVITIQGAILNVADLYYSEKFCRENNVKQNLFYLDAVDFYESGKYLTYIEPYYITEPHVASHFWLLEQCQSYPIIGGDWPWVHTHAPNMIISPYKLSFSSYERFLKDRGIHGIGDFICHSFESVHKFVGLHIQNKHISDGRFHHTPFIKQRVYGLKELRLKSYGWEDCPPSLFNIRKYVPKTLIANKFNYEVAWGDKLKTLLNSEVNSNNKF